MRHNALKTFDGKTAATTDQIGAAITRIGHARPVDAGNLHLQIQTATAPQTSRQTLSQPQSTLAR